VTYAGGGGRNRKRVGIRSEKIIALSDALCRRNPESHVPSEGAVAGRLNLNVAP